MRILALLLFFPLPAKAVDLHSGDIVNLNYYPHRGVVELNPHVAFALRDESATSANTDQHISYNQIYLGAVYGIAPFFRIGFSDTFLWDQTTQSATSGTGAPVGSTTAGPSNPTLTAAYRVFESASTGLAGDVAASGTPSLGRRVAPDVTTGTIGTNYSGGPSAGAIASLFWRCLASEFGAVVSGTRNFPSDTHGATPATTFTTSPYWVGIFSFHYRWHFHPDFYLGASLVQTLAHDADLSFVDGASRSVHADPYLDRLLSFGFRPDPFVALATSVSFNRSSSTSVSANRDSVATTNQSLVVQLTFLRQFW